MSGDVGARGSRPPKAALDGPEKSTFFDVDYCLALLSSRAIGRLSFSANALPAIVPVRYWLAEDEIYLRLGSDRWLPQLLHNQVVQLQIDEIVSESMTGWQVTATGMTAPVPRRESEKPADRPAHLALRPQLITGHPIELADGAGPY